MPLNLQNIRIESNTSTMGLNFSYTTISSRLLNNQYINYPNENTIQLKTMYYVLIINIKYTK